MDERALKILLDTYWSPSGWKPSSSSRPTPEDFSYAKSKGMMFDPVDLGHDRAVEGLHESMIRLDRRRVAKAFVASLSTRRLDWRSPLGSYAVFEHIPMHSPKNSERVCSVCGVSQFSTSIYLNILNFERFKWGGVRHNQVTYAALDLKLFLASEVPPPTPNDVLILRNIIDALASVHPEVSSAQAQTHFAKVVKSNKAERDVLVGVLGFCGILGTSDHPGFSNSFIPVTARALPDRRFVDMPYPACWWKGGDGINVEELQEFFGHLL